LQLICEYLRDNVNYYDWVGFYFSNKKKNILTLGPFAGKSTEHVQIPVGKGICSQVAQKKETMIVQDIKKEENYLSCSIDVRSEIVVPILKDGNFIGELDIDSHSKSPFTTDDREFLERVCEMISILF
ncbi:MAG: GAF domain-containing protein, partial [Candidatus Cloacimonetes bacterium]|nr:GAF domain-containing protein [Candidatus Cloacimonadota bacterium]